MTKILALIDGSIYSASVAGNAAWAAKRLDASIELLQVLGRRQVSADDRSGSIGAGARRRLLERLAALDAERAQMLNEKGWMELDEARAQIEAEGVSAVTTSLRNGDILETLHERTEATDLLVVGKRGEAADFAKLHLGSNLERILRTADCPILVTARAFRPITKVLFAFDGRQGAMQAVEGLAASPLLRGVAVSLVAIGRETDPLIGKLQAAASQLRDSGMVVDERIIPGEVNEVIPALVEAEEIDLLVMGAYGHSRLRTLVIGSTTSEMIRACRIPVLVWR